MDYLLIVNLAVKKSVVGHLYSALLWDEPVTRRSDMACDSKGITQFYLPPTHEPYLPLLPSRRASAPFGWYSLCLPTEGWPGWVDLGDWLYTEIGFLHWDATATNGHWSMYICQDLNSVCYVLEQTLRMNETRWLCQFITKRTDMPIR